MRHGKLIALAVLLTSLQISPAAIAEIPKNVPEQVDLQVCKSATEFDCIEYLKYFPDSKSSELMQMVIPPNYSETDKYGQRRDSGASYWATTEKVSNPKKLVLYGHLSTETYKDPNYDRLYPALWLTFGGLSKADIDNQISVEISLRMSWLVPVASGVYGQHGSLTQTKITGGYRYVFKGTPFMNTQLNDPTKYQKLINGQDLNPITSDSENPTLYFVIDHASSIPGGSFWDASCASQGYSFTSDNAIVAGQPFMDSPNSLNFNMGAAHFKSDGTINQGFFEYQASVAYLNCKWPNNTLTTSPYFKVSIISPDGQSQVTTSQATIENGIFKLKVYGFHYSSPTINVSGTNEIQPTLEAKPAPITTEPQVAKVKKVICIKGKFQKVLVGKNPVCPKGFKAK